jgi:hypothetical protein
MYWRNQHEGINKRSELDDVLIVIAGGGGGARATRLCRGRKSFKAERGNTTPSNKSSQQQASRFPAVTMRAKRSKKYRKLMHQYEMTFGFHEPYQVLGMLRGGFIF